jgi:hypothetical protein
MPRARPQQLSPGRSPTTVGDRGSRPDIVGRRKERKRATDREAQREHRKRKKQYVEELEAKIEFMKATSCTDQVATLLRENEDLRQQVKNSTRSYRLTTLNIPTVAGLQDLFRGRSIFDWCSTARTK